MTEKEKADVLAVLETVGPACDSLMAEACGHGVTDWGAVNDMLCAVARTIATLKHPKTGGR